MIGMFPDLAAVAFADITVDVVVDFFTAQSEALFAIFPYHTHADLEIIVAGMSSVEGVTVFFIFPWVIGPYTYKRNEQLLKSTQSLYFNQILTEISMILAYL